MIKDLLAAKTGSAKLKGSSFHKPAIKRNLSILGTSGLVLGLGLSGNTVAVATEIPAECTEENTVEAVGGDGADETNFNNIEFALNNDAENEIICLSGDFVISGGVITPRSVRFIGIGDSSLESSSLLDPFNNVNQGVISGGGVFFDREFDITIENLTIKNASDWTAVGGRNVTIIDSTFTGNTYGAVWAGSQNEVHGNVIVTDSTFSFNNPLGAIYSSGDVTVESSTFESNGGSGLGTTNGGAIYSDGDVAISNSTFSSNESNGEEGSGGAVYSANLVQIDNSTFDSNSAEGFGGAVYAGYSQVTNSTFIGNETTNEDYAEGGAIFSSGGSVWLSTFVNNTAAAPDDGADIPGEAIYKGSGPFDIYGNIFVGSTEHPQLGVGVAPGEEAEYEFFYDSGGNVFSTSSEVEQDVESDATSLFGVSISSLFGSANPELGTHEPNTFGTQTIALVAGSPAINIVDSDYAEAADEEFVWLDQRGATRTGLFDAGAFEFVSPVAAVTPPVAATTPPVAATTPPPVLAKTGPDSSLWMTWSSAVLVVIGGLALTIASRLRRTSN